MNELVNQLKDLALERIKNTLVMSFIFAWSVIHYDIVLTLLFSSKNVEDKIQFIQIKIANFDIWTWLIYPLLVVLAYEFLIPMLNLFIQKCKYNLVDTHISEHKNKTLIDYYEDQKAVKEAKIKLDSLEKQQELDIKAKELDLQAKELEILERKKQAETNNTTNIAPTVVPVPSAPINTSKYPIHIQRIDVNSIPYIYNNDFFDDRPVIKLKDTFNENDHINVSFLLDKPLGDTRKIKVFNGYTVTNYDSIKPIQIQKKEIDNKNFSIEIVEPTEDPALPYKKVSNSVQFAF